MALDADADVEPMNTRRIKLFSSIALIFFGFFAIVIIAFHFINPAYNPSTSFISEYAVGRYGALMSLAFITLGVGSLLLVAGLYYGLPQSARSTLGLVLISLWAICLVIAGLINTDAQGVAQTAKGQMHDKAVLLAFVVIVVGSFLMLRFKRDDDWQSFYQISLLISIFMALAVIDFIISFVIGTSSVGIVQRVFVGIVLMWLIAVAKRLGSL
jgi:hypothetical protein